MCKLIPNTGKFNYGTTLKCIIRHRRLISAAPTCVCVLCLTCVRPSHARTRDTKPVQLFKFMLHHCQHFAFVHRGPRIRPKPCASATKDNRQNLGHNRKWAFSEICVCVCFYVYRILLISTIRARDTSLLHTSSVKLCVCKGFLSIPPVRSSISPDVTHELLQTHGIKSAPVRL